MQVQRWKQWQLRETPQKLVVVYVAVTFWTIWPGFLNVLRTNNKLETYFFKFN